MIVFGRQGLSNLSDIQIKMGGNSLGVCTDYEYLGVNLDCNLNLNKMVSKTVSSTSNRLSIFGKIRDAMSKKVVILVFKQTIAPVLEYCGYVYNGLTLRHQGKLQCIQNRCLQVCLKVRMKYSVLKLHSETNVDFLSVRHDIQLLMLVHKYVYGGMLDPHRTGIVPKTAPTNWRVTRSSNTMELNYPEYAKPGTRKSPLYRGVDMWNRLKPA